MTRIFYFTWVKPACCVSKISSDGGCQSKETGVGMGVRLSSVGARGFFLAASRLSFAASPLNVLSPPTRKKPLAPRVMQIVCNVNWRLIGLTVVLAKQLYHDSFRLSRKRLFALQWRYDSWKGFKITTQQRCSAASSSLGSPTGSTRTSYNFC